MICAGANDRQDGSRSLRERHLSPAGVQRVLLVTFIMMWDAGMLY